MKTICALLLSTVAAAGFAQLDPEGGRLVDLNGTRIYVHRIAAGNPEEASARIPIYVIHGGPLLDHGYLEGPLAGLAEDRELVFADQRLSGRSAADAPVDGFAVATLVDDIEALRIELGHPKIGLLAHSWGGLLALEYALRYPATLASLVLVSSMPPSAEMFRNEQIALSKTVTTADSELQRQLRETEAFKARESSAIRAMLILSFRSSMVDPSDASQLSFYVPEDYAERSQRFAALAGELQDFDLTPELGRITVPTLILLGDAEPSAQLGGPALAAGIEGAQLTILEHCGHFAFIEQPAAFEAALRDFYERFGG